MRLTDFLRFVFKMSHSKGQLVRDMQILRQEISPLKSVLVPFNQEEMELLSFSQSNVSRKKGFSKLTKGIFDTIYFEHLVAYAVRKFRNQQVLTLVCTATDEFIYYNKGDKTHVYFNDKEVGVLTESGQLYNMKGQLLLSIEGKKQTSVRVVKTKTKELGSLSYPKNTTHKMPRAFLWLNTMTDEERTLFVCLTFYRITQESLPDNSG